MKQFILTAMLLIVGSSFGQRQPIKELTHKQTQAPAYFQKIKNRTPVVKYTASNGLELKQGDTLALNIPSSNESINTISGSKNTQNYSSITLGKPVGVGNIMAYMSGETPSSVPGTFEGTLVVVKKMTVNHKGGRKKPLAVAVLLGDSNDGSFGLNKYIYSGDLERSFLLGELVSSDIPMTREQAIALLKETKDLLDLGMINQEDFDKKKKELTPIIMNN